MNRLGLWLARRLAWTLEPRERDAFLGDQSELGMSGVRAAREALGVVSCGRRNTCEKPEDKT
jgi:hypothetical protein